MRGLLVSGLKSLVNPSSTVSSKALHMPRTTFIPNPQHCNSRDMAPPDRSYFPAQAEGETGPHDSKSHFILGQFSFASKIWKATRPSHHVEVLSLAGSSPAHPRCRLKGRPVDSN